MMTVIFPFLMQQACKEGFRLHYISSTSSLPHHCCVFYMIGKLFEFRCLICSVFVYILLLILLCAFIGYLEWSLGVNYASVLLVQCN